MKRSWLFSLLIVWACGMSAQCYERLARVNQLVSGSGYVIVATPEQTKENYYAAMRASVSNGKLQCERAATEIASLTSQFPDVAHWTLRGDAEGFRLATADGDAIFAADASKIDVKLSSNSATTWVAEANADSTFFLYNADNNKRNLSWGLVNGSVVYGNYAKNDNSRVSIYRLKESGGTQGEDTTAVTPPHDDTFWDAEALRTTDWKAVSYLDLTDKHLPNDVGDFANTQPENTPIYVNESDAALVPESWKFVIVGDHLLRPYTLRDGLSLVIPRAFRTNDAATLTYERQAYTSGWESLYLPFAFNVPSGFRIETFDGWETGSSSIYFARIEALSALTSAIMCYEGAPVSTEKTTFRVEAIGEVKSCNIQRRSASQAVLQTDGSQFVNANEATKIPPFRSDFNISQQAKIKHIQR